MQSTQRTVSAAHHSLKSATLLRSQATNSSDSGAATASAASPANHGVSLLVSLDASSRESMLGSQAGQQGGALQAEGETPAGEEAAGTIVGGRQDSNKALQTAVQGMQQNLQSLARDPEAFHAALARSFGDTYDKVAAENIRQQTLAGDFSWMPDIRVVEASTLKDQSGTQAGATGLGAYSAETGTLYISADLLGSDPAKAVSILTEEVGHALDATLNTHDAAGDEGDIFARIVGGEQISDTELAALRAENDSGTIVVDGKAVEVEYGLGSVFKKAVKSVGKAIKRTVDGVVDAVKDVGRSIENGFKKIIDSPIFNAIMSIAQYIPIPVVAAVATVYNALRAGYQVVQGLRQGSIGAVLGGVASLAGGAAKLGGTLGASQTFIAGASRISDVAGKAGQVYRAAATKDFSAALSITAEIFQGTSASPALAVATQASGVRDAVRSGNITGALAQGATLAGGLAGGQRTASLLADINGHASLISGLASAVKQGDYTAAAAGFVSRYGSELGIDKPAQANILNVAQALETVDELRTALRSDDYPTALRSVAESLGLPIDAHTLGMLEQSLELRDAVRSENVGAAARSAAMLASQSGRPELAARFEQLASLLGARQAEPGAPTPPYVPEMATQGA